MADEKTVLQYKGRPLMRKDNMIYYGSMADSHIVKSEKDGFFTALDLGSVWLTRALSAKK